ncbi:MAG: UvrD-helicase domain-containing protein [Clostridia bacterium]|nr:UvrD-helicase domain-containing protein [Clostridia bacterium]
MLFANDYNDNRIHIDETQSNQTYYCPYCGAPMITKKGNVCQHHFAHSASYHCSDTWEQTRAYDMSIWHNEWQSRFPKANQEIKLSLGDTRHRADVLIDSTVVEFQHSIMPVKSFDDRNNFYFNLGYKVVWLFDLSDIYCDGNLSYCKENGRLCFKWNNPKKAFNSYDVKSGCIDLFFQLSEDTSEDKIVRVLDVSEKGFEQFYASNFISKDNFLEYVGLRNGQCAPPSRDDVEKNQEYTEFCQKYDVVLNKQQERAVQAIEGSNLLLAVPGSGKTTALISRLGHMVFNKGINPSNILAITFNRKASDEMKERFAKKFGWLVGNQIRFSTINTLCYSIYRRYCQNEHIAEKRLVEGKERRKILVDILSKYSDEYPSENEILDFEQALDYIKNMMLSDTDLIEWNKSYCNIREMYYDYQKVLEDSRQMDFDDQMVLLLKYLTMNRKY